VHLTGTLINLCFRLASIRTVHIESFCLDPPIRVFMAVGFISASRWCHSLDSEIVSDFQVDSVFVAIGALGAELSSGCELSLGGERSRFRHLQFSVVDDSSVVAGTMIYLPLTSYPMRVQEDGEDVRGFPLTAIMVLAIFK